MTSVCLEFGGREMELEKAGWLTKRTKISGKWKRQWFILKKNHMLYGDSEHVCLLIIVL